MDRRQFLITSGGALTIGTIGGAGYFKFFGARMSSAADVTLSPGEEGILTITWKEVKSIKYNKIPNSDEVEIDISDVEFSSSPHLRADSSPPSYHWEEPTEVEMNIPVSVTAEAAPVDYHLGLKATGLVGIVDEPSHTLTVTVTDS